MIYMPTVIEITEQEPTKQEGAAHAASSTSLFPTSFYFLPRQPRPALRG